MINIAVCDDEAKFIDKIKSSINEFFNEKNIDFNLDIYSCGEELSQQQEKISEYDIIFLDINMRDMDGIETAKKIREYSDTVNIVFITAFIECSTKGYEVRAIRYILKDNPNFDQVLRESIEVSMNQISRDKFTRKFKFNEGERSVQITKICYIESQLHKIIFHMDNGKTYSAYDKLDAYEESLGEGFLRIHKSYLVNATFVKCVKGMVVILNDGTELKLSRPHKQDVVKALISYEGTV